MLVNAVAVRCIVATIAILRIYIRAFVQYEWDGKKRKRKGRADEGRKRKGGKGRDGKGWMRG